MINVDYSNKQIKVTTDYLSRILPIESLPVKVDIKKKVSGESWWYTRIFDSMWATFPDNEMNDVEITDNQGKLIYKYEWNVLEHGSIFYKSLYYYCKQILSTGKKPKGLAIGTHDGEFGEWVPVALEQLSDIVLIEGSKKQYDKLCENYKDKGFELMNQIVTPEGGEVEFFEGGKGYTNSVVESVIRSWETEEINSSKRTSISINELIEEKFQGKFDWLHLDIEGLDAKLIMAIEEKYLPKFIIFEDNNFNQEQRDEIYKYLSEKNYITHSEKGICMANKV
jgi:FkbM family methyltransferase